MNDDSSRDVGRRQVLKSIGAAGTVSAGVLGATETAAASSTRKGRARKMAENTVEFLGNTAEFSNWQKKGVQSPELFYAKVKDSSSGDDDTGVEYVPSALVFPIEDDGEDAGYMTIDAISPHTPVLAYGKSKAPQRKLDDAVRTARASGHSLRQKYIYHSGVEFGVETTGGHAMDLRQQSIKRVDPAESVNSVREMSTESTYTTMRDEPPEWSGSTDDSVAGNPPNWTESDDGGDTDTEIGTGRDSWSDWDGCSPVAASMAIGYHEGINEWEDDKINALIDILHKKMNTSSGGSTRPDRIDGGIEKYNSGNKSYNATNRYWNPRGNIKDSVGNDNPCMLNMTNSGYTKHNSDFGHSVTAVGYRTMSCGLFCDYTHYKVYSGHGTKPDRVANGNWLKAMVTRIKPK